jgi:thiol:disulfide interchange protein
MGCLGVVAMTAHADGWSASSQPTAWGQPPVAAQAHWVGQGLLTLQMTVQPGEQLDRHSLAVTASPGWRVIAPVWPQGTPGLTGHPVFTAPVQTQVQVQAVHPTTPLALTVQWQGCTTAGVCHPPASQTLTLPMPSSQPTVVVLTGTWCGACQTQDQRLRDPRVRRALQPYQVVTVALPDDDTAQATLAQYGVLGVPALRVYGAHEPVSPQGGLTLLGETSVAQLTQALASAHP